MEPSAQAPERVATYASGLGFPLDAFQADALAAVDGGRSVLVAAPTGAGKTVVAEFACWLSLHTGAKCFYTTPIKALSNQKFGDLAAVHGSDHVGLLTGDNTINGEAPLVVMTTEVLRNMLYERSPTLTGLRWVVLDEVHYLRDPYRGAVWEEVLIHLPPEVGVVCLSATVSNVAEFGEWIEAVRGPTDVIVERERPVELRNLVMVGQDLHPLMVQRDGGGTGERINPQLVRAWARGSAAAERFGHSVGRRRRDGERVYTPTRVEMAEVLRRERMLPAICFIFSRVGCDKAAEACILADLRFTTPEEASTIREVAETRAADIDDEDLRALDFGTFLEGLVRGVAAHHAGMIPVFKETVEELFKAGLVKLVFATETLALGINMPARTVAIERLSKFTGERHELLTPTDYTQLTGRAGRRGIDEVGYAAILYGPWVPLEQVATLATVKAYDLQSSFRPSYNMAVNLVRNHPPDEARHVLNSSFAQFTTDREVVRWERRLADREREVAEIGDGARCDRGDVEEYRQLRRRLDEVQAAQRGSEDVRAAFARLAPGDVIHGRGLGKALVVEQLRTSRGGVPQITVMTLDRKLRRLGPRDFRTAPEAVARIRVKGNSWRSPKVRRTLSRELSAVSVAAHERAPGKREVRDLRASTHAHPCHRCPDIEQHLEDAERLERARAEAATLRKRVSRRKDTLARTFERVLDVLRELGYVDDWELSAKGGTLARVYCEADLLVVECLWRGWFGGLDAIELASMMSLFVYESRGREEPASAPTPHLSRLQRRAANMYRSIQGIESDHDVALLKEPEAGFMAVIYEWAEGASLEEVLEDRDLSAGDFVRWAKQVVDLLQQLREVVREGDLAEVLSDAIKATRRGVVAYSGV